jgi:hypothetical protein
MLRQKLIRIYAGMDGPLAPEQKDLSARGLGQVSEKGPDIQSADIPAAKLRIERLAFPLRRQCKARRSGF